MRYITVSVDDEVYRRARVRAAKLHTSVSAVVRELLTRFACEDTELDRRLRLQRETLESIRAFRASNRLSRDQAHDRSALR
jgi:plasmid stability protein